MAKSKRELELLRTKVEGYLNIIRIQRELELRSANLLEQAGLEGITPAQASALLVLVQEQAPTTAARLAELLNVSPVTVGRFVKSLLDNKWIRRKPDPADARAMLIEPTKKTLNTLPAFFAVTGQLMDEAYAGYKAGEIQSLVELLIRTRRNLYEASGKPDSATQMQLL